MPVEQALMIISAVFNPLKTENLPLNQTLGRTLAKDQFAAITQPPFDASAMDGYAVRTEDVVHYPVDLHVIGEAPAGKSYQGRVEFRTAVRIFTGGPVPDGADAVIIQENTERLSQDKVRLLSPVSIGQNIRPAGNDFAKDQCLAKAGIVITSRHIGMLAAANIPQVDVTRKPRIALLSTGDELINVGENVGPDQIISSNNPLLSSLIMENGGEVIDLGIAKDNEAALEEKITLLNATKNIDLFITIGGASVGDHDLVQKVLSKHGLKINFWKIAIRPGKPMIFGEFNGIPMIGLPGNPSSAYVCAINFMLPALHIMLGRNQVGAAKSFAILAHDLPENGDRQDYMRAHYSENDKGVKIISASSRQDSAKLSSLAHANCLLVRPPHAPIAHKGDLVEILLLIP
ncbi:MAG: molybdopterin molybdotransferase MoeA [Emcibacter sp.]|nr:molybdopterin molybdotransferase MoeA [Emcibacter sp.]